MVLTMKNETFKDNFHRSTLLALSLPTIFLIIIASLSGLLIPGTYYKESINWTTQSMGQDLIDLFLIIPFYLLATTLAAKNSKIAFTMWGGINLYLIYTFVIYCFSIHFN